MITKGGQIVASRQLLVALNDGKFARAMGGMEKKSLHMKWKSNNKSWKLPFATVAGRKPTKKQIAMARIFDLISYAVYPYWAYNINTINTEQNQCGALIIEVSKLKPLSSIMNIKTTKLCNKPNNINVAFLEPKRLKIFLQNLGKTDSTIDSMVERLNSINPKTEMNVIFVMGGPSFTMTAQKNHRNVSFKSEANKFQSMLHKTGLKTCDFLEIAIKRQKIWAHALNVIVSDPDWMECIKKANTNYPTFEVFSVLNNNKFPKECTFIRKLMSSELKWQDPSPQFVSLHMKDIPKNAKTRHYRMMSLYTQISYLLFPFWAYKTRHNGKGLIVVCGQRMFNSLEHFVDNKGGLIENAKKLNATFLNVQQLKAYLGHFNLDPAKGGKPEMGTARHSYTNRTVGIGILFGFADVQTMCLCGRVSPKNKDYDSECKLFQNAMRKLDMKSCEYLEIDFNKKQVIGLSMNTVHDGDGVNFGFSLSENIKKQIDERVCGLCKAAKPRMRCSRCHNAWYCGAKCQRPHWKIHKKNCVAVNKK